MRFVGFIVGLLIFQTPLLYAAPELPFLVRLAGHGEWRILGALLGDTEMGAPIWVYALAFFIVGSCLMGAALNLDAKPDYVKRPTQKRGRVDSEPVRQH